MTKKYTLTVSDEKAKIIDEWKGKINLSKVFREAIERKIRILEAQNRNMEDGISAIIERLKREKKERLENFEDEGRKEGVRWAKNAYYGDLVDVGESCNPIDLPEIYLNKDCTWIKGWCGGVREFWLKVKPLLK